MSCKRYCAAEFNLKELRKHASKLYMWTLTFPYFATAETSRDVVRQFIQWANRHGANGVRVYEKHRSGSLHIHIVMDRYFYVRTVRQYWESLGGGRIHVKILNPDDAGLYIAKELMKVGQKMGFPKGTRLYATFGNCWKEIGKSLVNSIRFESQDFVCWLMGRGTERFADIKGFQFGLEYFGVGYAASAITHNPENQIGELVYG